MVSIVEETESKQENNDYNRTYKPSLGWSHVPNTLDNALKNSFLQKSY